MIPNTRDETKTKTDKSIETALNQMGTLKRILYAGLAATALTIGANKCADYQQRQQLKQEVGAYTNTVQTYESRISDHQQTLEAHQQQLKHVRENGFTIAEPCYDVREENLIDVTPCYTTKTD